ncbi:hypothetical protein SPF06_18620 [Sinomonas sp. JGH33]|uniref:RelA/SpoT domain-containing protein n=1 Tax=Sinomonas terricola TaxID=3110330 RepID=A0ABU5TAP5_9MICC|nr:hypothetical protein [Sinomonas sp. JGH33]MEA5456742.1 hypothetical protein [Sinomonas sp. JGH33]
MCRAIAEGGRRCDRTPSGTRSLTAADLVRTASDLPEVEWLGRGDAEIAQVWSEHPPAVAAEAIGVLRDVGRREPEITKSLTALEEKGRRLHGLEFRLKSPGSLARKIRARSRMLAGSSDSGLHGISARLSDVARYTVIAGQGDVAETARDIQASLSASGAKLAEADHSFVEGSTYKGLHMVYESDGLRFEVQVHTETSQSVKDRLHVLYEEARRLPPQDPRREVLERKMRTMSDTVGIPDGISALHELGGVPVERKVK